MDNFLNRFDNSINGTIIGFDRIIFKGIIKPIIYSEGMEDYLRKNKVYNKDFKEWVMEQSKTIIQDANDYSQKQIGTDINWIPSSKLRKEEIAHKRQDELEINTGLIGVFSCLESCYTYKSKFNPNATYPKLISVESRCNHLYFYYDHHEYGFMSIRLQTWAPYNVQIALNGREWLSRMLEKNNCGFIKEKNKFLSIDDYTLAQILMNSQLDTKWEDVLDNLLLQVFPSMPCINGNEIPYYWTTHQSELAKDYIFENTEMLDNLMEDFLKYALITGTGERVLKYLGHPVTKNGQPHHLSKPEVFTHVNRWVDGIRYRCWVDKNSLKFYNFHNVLRFESTINNPGKYKVIRHKQNFVLGDPKKLLKLRKGIADTKARAELSINLVNNFSNHIATAKTTTPFVELIEHSTKDLIKNSKNVRSIDITGKDLLLLKAISDTIFDVNGITNKGLQIKLESSTWAKGMSGKKLSSRITRHLALFRFRGLIKKISHQRKYSLTDNGRELTTMLNITCALSRDELLKFAA